MPQQSIDKSIVKATLGNRGGMGSVAGRGTAAASGYHYGWPSGGTLEPDVVAQWLFDEASGDIVDEVSGLTVQDLGSPTYSVAATGEWSGVSPGITCTLGGGYFGKLPPFTQLNISATDDFVYEAVVSMATSASYSKVIFSTNSSEGTGTLLLFWTDATTFKLFLEADDGTLLFTAFTFPNIMGDGLLHKIRMAFDRSGDVETFIDGVSKGTVSLATLSGKAITTPAVGSGFYLGLGNEGNPASSFHLKGTLFETRITIGNCTNNSGGPGGG